MINVECTVAVGIVCLVLGFLIGRYVKNKSVHTFYSYLNGLFRNLDNYVMAASALVVVVSIILSAFGKIEKFASVTINIFGTIVFSWLLTKKSSKEEFKEHEQDLALRAYRHINYLETAANSTYKTLEDFKGDEAISKEVKLMLSNAMSQIKYIQGGINTCKMDWADMLSPEQRLKCMDEEYSNSEANDYGTVDVVVPDTQMNQEDA